MDSQTVVVLVIILGAVLYVTRTVWPARHKQPGCSMCPHNRNRADDYV